MSTLKESPPDLVFDEEEMLKWGYLWRIGTKGGEENVPTLTAVEAGLPAAWHDLVDEAKKAASAFDKKQGMDFGIVFDRAVGNAIASMLGDVPVVDFAKINALKRRHKLDRKAAIDHAKQLAEAAGSPPPRAKDIVFAPLALDNDWTTRELLPPHENCVEVGPARIIGGIRPQNFDVVYRPDGPRIAYDSKTLNDSKSIQKNWQNMVNDLGTEATTVHTRFPYAISAFIVAVPKPALRPSQEFDLIRTLERLAGRNSVLDQAHLAEAIAFVVWDPMTGKIDENSPGLDSPLHYKNFMRKIHRCYVERYKGLPPHSKESTTVEE